MGNSKKSYCIKLLHLALALSLLHVDPDSFLLQQRLRNWDSQLEFSHGNGWELEMLRAVPMVPPEYPYANRKSMLPLIEDLVLYDRYRETEQLRTDFNVTAYQLLSDSGTGPASSNQSSAATAAVQDLQTPAASSSSNVASSETESLARINGSRSVSPELDLFLTSDNLNEEERSLWEQNLADLHDFGDIAALNPYANLPLKDDPQSSNGVNFFDINLEPFLPSFSDVSSRFFNEEPGAGASNGSFPLPNASINIKVEEGESDETTNRAKCENQTNDEGAACLNVTIKSESAEENEPLDLPEVDLSPFINFSEAAEEVIQQIFHTLLS